MNLNKLLRTHPEARADLVELANVARLVAGDVAMQMTAENAHLRQTNGRTPAENYWYWRGAADALGKLAEEAA